MKLSELEKKVFILSKSWGLHDQSTWQKQVEKWGEEYGELLCAGSSDEEKDAYGDQIVCLINAKDLYGGEVKELSPNATLSECIRGRNFNRAIYAVTHECLRAGYNPDECMSMAYDTIKGRVILMVDGKAVKWESMDLTQRLKVAKTGRLKSKHVDLHALADHCTADDWDKIVAVSNSV